eukprot:1835043-Ditylum_brightwellii.AAC.1
MFLQTGATFHLLGSLCLTELIEDDEKFDNNQTMKRFTLNTVTDLYSTLYREESGKCQLDAKVVLDSAYDCHVQECYVEQFIPNVIVYQYQQ